MDELAFGIRKRSNFTVFCWPINHSDRSYALTPSRTNRIEAGMTRMSKPKQKYSVLYTKGCKIRGSLEPRRERRYLWSLMRLRHLLRSRSITCISNCPNRLWRGFLNGSIFLSLWIGISFFFGYNYFNHRLLAEEAGKKNIRVRVRNLAF